MQLADYRLDPATLLQPETGISLSAWYASPFDRSSAQGLLDAARQREQQVLAEGGSLFGPRVAALIARYWLGGAIDLDYRSLLVVADSGQRALLELVYGQLLMSRKRSGANDHLKSGFTAAAQLLSPPDYFAVLKRHELLRRLPLSESGSAPMALPDLLTEAKVISQLGGFPGGHGRLIHNPGDTLG